MIYVTNKLYTGCKGPEWKIGDPPILDTHSLEVRVAFIEATIEVEADGEELRWLNYNFDGLPNCRLGKGSITFVGDAARFIVANLR